MGSTEYRWYILFPNHHQGLRLNRRLKELEIKNQIAPTPRAASSCCGMSLIVEEEDLGKINQIIVETDVTIEKIVKLPIKNDWQYRGL